MFFRKVSSPMPLLLFVLLVALVLRVWGTSFGLPYVYHPDEGFEVNRALQLGTGQFDFSMFRMLKGGYFYLLFIEFGLLYVFLLLLGVVNSTHDFALLYVSDPTYFYLIGRITTAVIGTLTVYLTYRIGTRLHSTRLGLVAAAFLSVNPLHVELSHYITVDGPLTCLSLVSIIFIVRMFEQGLRSDYMWAAFFVSLATITKLPGIVLVVPMAFAHIGRTVEVHGYNLKALFAPNIIVAGVIFLAVFFSTNPGALIYFGDFVQMVLKLAGKSSVSSPGVTPVLSDSDTSTNVSYYLLAIYHTTGLPILFISLIGAGLVLLRHLRTTWIPILFGVSFFLLISLTPSKYLVYERYILPIVPIIFLFTAYGVEAVLAAITRYSKVLGEPVFVALLVSLLAVRPLVASVSLDREFVLPDTRTEAKIWIEANVPEGATILLEGHTARPEEAGVHLNNLKSNLRAAIDLFEARGEDGKAAYFRYELKKDVPVRYDLVFFSPRNIVDLSTSELTRVDYVVVRADTLLVNPKYAETGKALLDWLRSAREFEQVQRFSAENGQKRGPDVEIFRRRAQAVTNLSTTASRCNSSPVHFALRQADIPLTKC